MVANAYVGPIVSRYLGDLEQRLQQAGFRGDLMIMQSNGGLSDIATARRQCIQMLESGPAGGVVGTMALCEALDLDAAIAFNMGGTTAKASVVRRGQPSFSPDYFIGGYNEGLAIRIPVLDIVEVGTGGGSIAWMDDGGALHVGPHSAGAEPGPACTAGMRPLRPSPMPTSSSAGSRPSSSWAARCVSIARRPWRPCARTSLSLWTWISNALPSGILEVAVAAMANTVRHVTLGRGLDPRDFTLVVYGGAGPLHAAAVARELAVAQGPHPAGAGPLFTLGMLMADLRRDYVQTLFARLNTLSMEQLEG